MLAQPVESYKESSGDWIAYTQERDTGVWVERHDGELLGKYLFNHRSDFSTTGIYETTHYARFTTFGQPEPCAEENATHIWIEHPKFAGHYVQLEKFEEMIKNRIEVPVEYDG